MIGAVALLAIAALLVGFALACNEAVKNAMAVRPLSRDEQRAWREQREGLLDELDAIYQLDHKAKPRPHGVWP